jgi:hypothetical protein
MKNWLTIGTNWEFLVRGEKILDAKIILNFYSKFKFHFTNFYVKISQGSKNSKENT